MVCPEPLWLKAETRATPKASRAPGTRGCHDALGSHTVVDYEVPYVFSNGSRTTPAGIHSRRRYGVYPKKVEAPVLTTSICEAVTTLVIFALLMLDLPAWSIP